MKVMAPEVKKVERSGWSKLMAKPGDELILAARLIGYMPGTPVAFRVFPTSGDPGAPIANLRGVSNEMGIAFVEWAYIHDPTRVKDPRLIFEAQVEGTKTLSSVLTIVDWIELTLQDDQGKDLAGKEVRVVDSLGYLHIQQAGPGGLVKLEKVACGDCMLRVAGYEVVGELRPGDRKFRSGQRHSITMREMKFVVEFESPRNGDVYLAGDRIAIKTKVRRAGQPWEGEATVTANNGARILGGRKAGQHGDSAAQTLYLPVGKDTEVEVQGKYDNATTTVKLRVVRPQVAELKLEGADAFKLYNHRTQGLDAAYAKFGKDGTATDQHPGAFRFGKKLRAKARVVSAEALTNPAKVEIALVTPPLDDTGLPANGIDKMAGKPLALRLPQDKRDAGAEFRGGEAGAWIDLESDRPLPNAVRTYKWNLEVRVNQKSGKGWAASDANMPIWPKVGDLKGLRVNAVFNEAKIGDGKDLDPAGDPLKRNEYDSFHVRLACAWASGAFNLLKDGDRSIPAKIAENARHLKWPNDYNWLRGKKKADHQRPQNFEKLADRGIYAGGGKACPCGGIVEDGACNKCGKLVASETRSAGAPTMTWDAAQKAFKCQSCSKFVPGSTPRAANTVTCPFENRAGFIVEAKCPTCGQFVWDKDLATGAHACETGDPTVAGPEPTSKNWGFGVIGNPTHPGGRVHQAASLLASAMGALGVKANVLYLRPRNGGAVNTVEHDPITRGADSFSPKQHWGKALLAFVGVGVDKSRDGEFQGVKLREDDTFVIEPTTRKRALHKDAATSSHELKVPDYSKLRDGRCRAGHEYLVVTTRTFPAQFFVGGFNAQLTLQNTSVPVNGEFAVEIAVPIALYGSQHVLPSPYGGNVTLQGPGGSFTKQLVGGVQWKNENGVIKSSKVEFPAMPAGEYRMNVTAFFNKVHHHPAFQTERREIRATVTVHTRQPGQPRPETTNVAVHEVGHHNGNKIAFKTSGRTSVQLVEAMAGPAKNQWGVERVSCRIDGGGWINVTRGETVEMPKVPAGDHTLQFAGVAPQWRARIVLTTNTIDDKGRPIPCPTCGAQPNWAYKCAKCGKEVKPDAKGKHDCGGMLEAPFADAIIYACPNCKRTVHDGDAECWGCGAKLEVRKADERFGLPKAGTASGGEKQPAPAKDTGKKADEGLPFPAGRYTLSVPGTQQKGVLTLGPEGQPSFINAGYYHLEFSRDEVKNIKWDPKAGVLAFVRDFEGRYGPRGIEYRLTFKPDGTFEGTWNGQPIEGKPRTEDDFAPVPQGTYLLKCCDAFWRAHLNISGTDPNNLSGWINFGVFHGGYGREDLRNVKWDALNHTLTFLRPGPNQRYWITFREGGRAYYGLFLNSTSRANVEGGKL